MHRRARHIGLLAAIALSSALAGCGVKGPLEPPPGAHVAAPATPAAPHPAAGSSTPAAGTAAPAYVPPRSAYELNNSVTPHADWQKQKQSVKPDPLQGAKRPDQPFILDGLL